MALPFSRSSAKALRVCTSAAGSSSQGRKSTLPVQALVHAFHCTDTQCQQKTCADTKQVLKRMEVHVQQCPTRRAQQSAQHGGPPPQQAECKACKLWQALHRTTSSSGQHQPEPEAEPEPELDDPEIVEILRSCGPTDE